MFVNPPDTRLKAILAELDRLVPHLDSERFGDKWWRVGKLVHEAKPLVGHGGFGAFKAAIARKHKKGIRTIDYALFVYRACKDEAEAKGLSVTSFGTAAKKGRRLLNEDEHQTPVPSACETSQIVLGDSLGWLKRQAENSVPFVITDPPYGVGKRYGEWTEPTGPDAFWEWFQPFWTEIIRVLIPGGCVVLWQSSGHLSRFADWFPGSKVVAHCYTFRSMYQWEPLIYWAKPGAAPLCPLHGPNEWFRVQGLNRSHKPTSVHPHPKNPLLCEFVVKRFTRVGSLVLDPFCGSGMIPLACKTLGRQWFGVELNPTYADEARRRLG